MSFWIDPREDRRRRKEVVAKVRELYPGTVTIEGHFSGGNDDSGYDEWTAVLENDERVSIDFDIRLDEDEAIGFSPVDGELRSRPVHLTGRLEEAYWDAHGYGTFAGEFYVEGVVTVDALTSDVRSSHGTEKTYSWDDF